MPRDGAGPPRTLQRWLHIRLYGGSQRQPSAQQDMTSHARPRPDTHDLPTDAARRILDTIEAHYQTTHRYVPATPADFPHLDLAWYDRVAAEFEGLGFQRFGDIEDKTITDVPHTVLRPTFIRALVSRDGTVVGALFDPRLKGIWLRLLLWVFRKLPGKVVEFETECSDGSFVGTSNGIAASVIALPPAINVAWMPMTTPAATVYAEHSSRLAAHLAARPGVTPLVMRTPEDMMRSQHRQNALKAAFRGEIAGLTTEELKALSLFGDGHVPRVRVALDEEHAMRRTG